MPTFLDLFAGAGGLSEGFIQAGYKPVAHVEMDTAACNTLRTREAFHWLRERGKLPIYESYLKGDITRSELYSQIPLDILARVIEQTISSETLPYIFSSIDKLLGDSELDFIIGGPPCQAYSLAGRSRDVKNMVGDPRNYLYKYYAEFLKKYQPKCFLFENVVGLLTARDYDGQLHFDKMRQLFSTIGYSIDYRVLNAKDYGIPQNRRRVIIIGKRGQAGAKSNFPKLIAHESTVPVKNLLEDLPSLHAGEGKVIPVKTDIPNPRLVELGIAPPQEHLTTFQVARPNQPRDLEIYKAVVEAWNDGHRRLNYDELPEKLRTHKNTASFLDRFKVVAGDLPYAQTVVAHVCKDGHYYIHPDIQQNRSLTPREVARIQTFPDDYYFEGKTEKIASRTAAYKQIGNAVPVYLAKILAVALRDSIKD